MRAPVQLRDGSRIHIRPVHPGDRDGIAAGFERMSPESRYLRFFGPVPRLTERQLRYLTDVDHHDHEALLAIDADSGEGVGVARFVRTDDGVAEPAVAVTDDWQGRGVGAVLLDQLADRAREEGIHTFLAPVLAHNRAGVAVLRRLGEAEVRNQGREVEVRVRLDEPPGAGAGPRLHELLRRAAEDTIRPAVSFWHRLTVGRRPEVRAPANVIVVAAAGTRRSHPPLRQAMRLAGATGAAVHLVAARGVLLDDSAPEIAARMDETAAELRARGLEVACHVRRGDLAVALLDVAVRVRAALIVVDGAPRVPTGFAAGAWDHVAHHAPCNVLVAR